MKALKNIRILTYRAGELIHLESPLVTTHCLCSVAYDDEDTISYTDTLEKVNCTECLYFIKAIKKVSIQSLDNRLYKAI